MAEAKPILMPKLGQTVENSTLVSWKKKEGDPVKKGEVLFDIETDKAVLEAESFSEGILLKILVGEGETVPVQSVVAYVGQPGDTIPTAPPPPPPAAPEKPAAPAKAAPPAAAPPVAAPPAAAPSAPAPAASPSVTPPPAAAAPAAPQRLRISPRARRLAREKVIDPAPIRGSGPGGRILEKDVQSYLEAQGYDTLRITPAAKRLAAREGVDILRLRPSGEKTRITIEDVRLAVREKPQPMSKMRQVIARRLTESFSMVPHFYVTVAVDMTDLLAYRQELKAAGKNYKVTDFILQAVTLSLKEFDTVNSTTDGMQTWWHAHVDLGLAVSIEGGLVVPVIRQAETLGLNELGAQAAALAERARRGALTPDEMQGSTFTVSNMGMLDVDQFNAIINPGEGAILAVASTRPQAVVHEGRIAVRSMMNLTLSADHRLVDGATAAAFINAIKSKLQDIALWRMFA